MSSRAQRLLMLIILGTTVTSCAINDSGSKSAAPPITLKAPSSLVIKGSCDSTTKLEDWLEVTVPLRQQFQGRLSEAAVKNASDIYDDTFYLAGLLSNVTITAAPDCAADAQRTLTAAMIGAVNALQAYYNHTLSGDLNSALDQPLKSLSQAETMQNDLITQMRKQYQAENDVSSTTPSPSPQARGWSRSN